MRCYKKIFVYLCVNFVYLCVIDIPQNTQSTPQNTQSAIEVLKQLWPGLLEFAYQECLYYELIKAGLDVQKEKPIPIIYNEVKLDNG